MLIEIFVEFQKSEKFCGIRDFGAKNGFLKDLSDGIYMDISFCFVFIGVSVEGTPDLRHSWPS